MQKKDYEELAKINKKFMNCFVSYKEYCFFCKAQSDYFEKEDWNCINTKEEKDIFNRKQFLKDCGVEL